MQHYSALDSRGHHTKSTVWDVFLHLKMISSLFTCVLFIIVTFYLIFSRSVNFSLGDKKAVDDDEVEKRLRPSFLYSTYVSYLCTREGCHARKCFDFADFYYEIIIIADFSTFRLPFTRFCQNRYC